MKHNELKAFGKYLLVFAKMLLPGLNLGVEWIKSGDDLGYTYRRKKNATIFIATNHPYFKDLKKSEKLMFMTGIYAHELMHQILTNFVLQKKMTETLPHNKRKLFHTCFNIFEDSRIETFAASYFSGTLLYSLEYVIQSVWENTSDINPEDNIFFQVINAMVQYGDTGLIKGEMSDEAEELFEEIRPLFNTAAESKTCTNCLIMAQKAMEILFPYMPEGYEGEEDKTDSDSEGEEDVADDSGVGSTSASKTKRSRRLGGMRKDSSEEKGSEPEKDKDKDKSKSFGEEDEDSTDKSYAPAGGDGTGDGGSAPTGDDSEIEEIFESEGSTEEEFEEAAKALEEELERRVKEESKEKSEEKSDYDFDDTEHPAGDKWVKTISHHKASPNPHTYEEYVKIVKSDAHAVAKLIKRRFKNKSGGTEWADHGDLNLMRYKDPNFRSPYIFDDEKPKQKHSVAVMLLVDESGSMGGRRIQNARIATTMLAEAMAECHIPCCIVGHSGDSSYDCSVELEHYTTFKNTREDRSSIPFISARCQNRDGPAIRWA